MKEYKIRMWIEGRGDVLETPSLFYHVGERGKHYRDGDIGALPIAGLRLDAAVGKMVAGLKHTLEICRGNVIKEFAAEYVPYFEDDISKWAALREELGMTRPTYGRLGELVERAPSAPGITHLRHFPVPHRKRMSYPGIILEPELHRVWDAYLTERRGLKTTEFDAVLEYYSGKAISEIKRSES